MITIRTILLLLSRYTFIKFSWLILNFLLLNVLMACSGIRQFRVPDSIPNDRKPVPAPKPRKINIAKDVIEKQFFDQIEQSLDLSRQFRNLFGKPIQAFNVDAFGEVPNSSWFTNRNHVKQMTLEEIARGPNTGDGPDTSGTWTVISAKAEGVTPGFSIKDSRGERYVIKLEPTGYSELTSGAEVVSTKLFHAAGYNVPENYIVYFHPKILKLGKKIKFTDKKGRERYMTAEDLQEILKRIEILPKGHIRAMASKFLKGKAFLGPFKYKSTRKDDANDIIPHQHRRELRGLRVIAAWLNHYDTKDNNSLDVYVEEGYVKHYLIDFGSTLGSDGEKPMPAVIGHENGFDPHLVALKTITLGLNVQPWEKRGQVVYPSIGYFESKLFHSQKYKFILPNPPFELMTNNDGFWGAKIVMSFTDEQLKEAVAEGRYSNPEAAEYLLRTIIERRDIVGRYWFNRVNPLDMFNLQKTFDGGQELCFVDLAVESGLESTDISQYRYDLRRNDIAIQPSRSLQNKTCVLLPHKEEVLRVSKNSKSCANDEIQWEVKIQVRRGSSGKWSKWVKAYMTWDESAGEFDLIGIRRQE